MRAVKSQSSENTVNKTTGLYNYGWIMNRLKKFTCGALSVIFLMSIKVYAVEADLLASLQNEISAAAKLELENSGVIQILSNHLAALNMTL